jgi:arginyl-tRNA synthetase
MVEEVGKDVVRFTMLTRKPEAQMDFDFAKVVEASKDNPVFYVQYAHARIRSTCARRRRKGWRPRPKRSRPLGEDELALVKLAAQFPREVEAAAKAREPHRIAFYLYDLAARSTPSGTWATTIRRSASSWHRIRSFPRQGFSSAQIGQVVRNGLGFGRGGRGGRGARLKRRAIPATICP